MMVPGGGPRRLPAHRPFGPGLAPVAPITEQRAAESRALAASQRRGSPRRPVQVMSGWALTRTWRPRGSPTTLRDYVEHDPSRLQPPAPVCAPAVPIEFRNGVRLDLAQGIRPLDVSCPWLPPNYRLTSLDGRIGELGAVAWSAEFAALMSRREALMREIGEKYDADPPLIYAPQLSEDGGWETAWAPAEFSTDLPVYGDAEAETKQRLLWEAVSSQPQLCHQAARVL